MRAEIPEPDGDGPKEVYAFYGLAMYTAQVLEHSLLNLAVGLYLTDSPVRSREVFDATFDDLSKKTLGALIGATRKLMAIRDNVDDVLDAALNKRNYLTHHFFRENAERFVHATGQREMIAELQGLIGELQAADELVTPIYMTIWKRFGVDGEWVQHELEKIHREISARYGDGR